MSAFNVPSFSTTKAPSVLEPFKSGWFPSHLNNAVEPPFTPERANKLVALSVRFLSNIPTHSEVVWTTFNFEFGDATPMPTSSAKYAAQVTWSGEDGSVDASSKVPCCPIPTYPFEFLIFIAVSL